MKVKLSQAVKILFGNSSLEMVYFEAIANALDANADTINIEISANAYNEADSVKIVIRDNGEGFTDDRYHKFSELFSVEEVSHKGVGRLVYLCYFENIAVTSYYEKNGSHCCRAFEFSNNFDSSKAKTVSIDEVKQGTTLSMTGYSLSKLGNNGFIQAKYLKTRILEEFYPRLYELKKEGRKIHISISSTIDDLTRAELLSTDDLPELTSVELSAGISLFDKIYLHYSIKETQGTPSIITAIAVDYRTKKIDIIANENVLLGYEMIFLLYSDSFIGKVDHARQSLTLSESDMSTVKSLFKKKIAEIIAESIPKVAIQKTSIKKSLVDRYPHLSGYFEDENIGLGSRSDILAKAQETFFKAQKDILDANSLTDAQYESALELSARTLTEYILFRQITIDQLKSVDKKDLETKIHNIIVPQRSILHSANFASDIYRNNSWVLDDKFMTYSTILSEREMSDLIKAITKDEVTQDVGRPDIAIIFSNDPKTSEKVDVVIVELKKKGLKPEDNVRRLYDYYEGKIQSLWLYGIVELDDEYKSHLATAGYHPLYSKGSVFVNTNDITVNWASRISIPAVRYIMDIDSLINDADARNATFLNIIKISSINKYEIRYNDNV